MKSGTLIAIIILSGYVALEAYTIRKASQRMEPAYIHNLLVEAKAATELCNSTALELESRFARTLQRATDSYAKDLLENNSDLSAKAVEEQIEQQTVAARLTATEAVNTDGCSHPDSKAQFQRYRIYARKSR
ncbi:MAG: hypothetical protein AB8B97_11055 [Granulosicoccus sp.]